jgi:hypothetical protein
MWFGFAFRMARPTCTLMNQTNRQPLAVGLASTYKLATTGSYFSLLACSMYEADLWLSPTVEQPLSTSVPSAWTQTNPQSFAFALASTYDLATTESYFSLSACSMYEADLWLSPTVERRWALAGLAEASPSHRSATP